MLEKRKANADWQKKNGFRYSALFIRVNPCDDDNVWKFYQEQMRESEKKNFSMSGKVLSLFGWGQFFFVQIFCHAVEVTKKLMWDYLHDLNFFFKIFKIFL